MTARTPRVNLTQRTNPSPRNHMTKNQAHKKRLYARRQTFTREYVLTAEDRAWLDMVPIGREFGSPDFERLEVEENCLPNPQKPPMLA